MGWQSTGRPFGLICASYAYGTANTSDFESVIQAYSRWDLKKFFRFWLTQNAHPVVDCRVSREGKQIRLDLDYRNADILAWEQHIPVAVYRGKRRLYRWTLLLKRGKRHVRYRISGGEDDIFVVLDASLETLAEVRPHKDRSMWVAQLRYGPNFIAKERALSVLAAAEDKALPELID